MDFSSQLHQPGSGGQQPRKGGDGSRSSNMSEAGRPPMKSPMTNYDYIIRILLLGDANVGKSSLMLRFTEGEFKSALVGTAGIDYKTKNI